MMAAHKLGQINIPLVCEEGRLSSAISMFVVLIPMIFLVCSNKELLPIYYLILFHSLKRSKEMKVSWSTRVICFLPVSFESIIFATSSSHCN